MTIPATMRALRQDSLEGPHGLHLVADTPVPRPGPGEVLIRVTAAGVNYLDLSQSRGASGRGPQPPYVAGIEAAGEVVACSDTVSGIGVGDHVVGASVSGGAFAEYVVLPAMGVIPVPPGWADDQALGMAVSWPTALAALRPLGALEAGQTVLVHAAAGGTGQAAVTLAKHYGARVIAAASPEKHEVARALGADQVIDSRGSDLVAEIRRLTDGAGVDLVLESVGGATLAASLSAAKRATGRVVVFGLPAGEATISNWDLVYANPVHVIGLNLGALIQSAPEVFGAVMGELGALIGAGVLRPSAPTVYRLADGLARSPISSRARPSASWRSFPDPQLGGAWSRGATATAIP